MAIAAWLFSIGAAQSAPAAERPATHDSIRSVRAVHRSYRLGEPVWLDIKWRDKAPLFTTPAIYPRIPEARAVDANGTTAYNPRHRMPFSGDAVTGRGPDPTTRSVVDAASGLVLPPGRWHIEVRAADDARWHSTTVTIEPVTTEEAHQVVDALAPDLAGQGTPGHGYDALGHEIYVPILEAILAKSSPGIDERALYGLDACPCVAATAALLRVHEQVDDVLLAWDDTLDDTARTIADKLANDLGHGKHNMDDVRFAEAVRVRLGAR